MNPPDLIPFGGNWSEYEEVIFEAFLESIVRAKLKYKGSPISVRFNPSSHDKHFAFWHLISKDKQPGVRNEDEREPEISRCERILWVGWIIQNYEKLGFKTWESKRHNETHAIIWCETLDYAVFLAKRSGYYLLKSAYGNFSKHKKESFLRDYNAFTRSQKAEAPPQNGRASDAPSTLGR